MRLKRNTIGGYGSVAVICLLIFFFEFINVFIESDIYNLIIRVILIVFILYMYFESDSKNADPLPAGSFLFVFIEHIPLALILLVFSLTGFNPYTAHTPVKALEFITVCLVVPFYEELAFRGMLMDSQLNSMTPVKAILLNSFIFTLLHIPAKITHLELIFIFSLITTYAYYRYRSILLCTLIHGFSNFISIVKRYFTDVRIMLSCSIFILSAFIILLLLHFLDKKRQRIIKSAAL